MIEAPSACRKEAGPRTPGIRILVNSHVFAPSVGGSESAGQMLIEGLCKRGYEVRVITMTPSEEPDCGPDSIFRCPSWRDLIRHVRWADVVVHNNISLRAAWPLVLTPRPWMIIHHSSLQPADASCRWSGWAKCLATLFATNIAVSKSMADSLWGSSVVLGNGYRDKIFRPLPDAVRDKELIFVGRLVEGKGADMAIRALARLREGGFPARLTMVGSGPLEPILRQLCADLGVADAISFTGCLSPVDLAELLNQHRIIVAPSERTETFGLVALEGLACGCLPVVSEVGGLSQTVGGHGVVVPEGDLNHLVRVLRELLCDADEVNRRLAGAEHHLERFQQDRVVGAYAELIESTFRRSRASKMAQLCMPVLWANGVLFS